MMEPKPVPRSTRAPVTLLNTTEKVSSASYSASPMTFTISFAVVAPGGIVSVATFFGEILPCGSRSGSSRWP